MIEFPQDKVIGLLGASYVNGTAPEAAGLPDLAGGSYKSLQVALENRRHRVVNAGQGGASSFDIPEQGWLGYNSQFGNLLRRTVWLDGVSRLSAVVVEGMNDCLWSPVEYPYSIECAQNYINNRMSVAKQAADLGHKVFVTRPIGLDKVNFQEAFAYYGFPYIINDEDYLELIGLMDNAFQNMPGVQYLDLWEKATTFDKLHPDEWSQDKAAKLVEQNL